MTIIGSFYLSFICLDISQLQCVCYSWYIKICNWFACIAVHFKFAYNQKQQNLQIILLFYDFLLFFLTVISSTVYIQLFNLNPIFWLFTSWIISSTFWYLIFLGMLLSIRTRAWNENSLGKSVPLFFRYYINKKTQ